MKMVALSLIQNAVGGGGQRRKKETARRPFGRWWWRKAFLKGTVYLLFPAKKLGNLRVSQFSLFFQLLPVSLLGGYERKILLGKMNTTCVSHTAVSQKIAGGLHLSISAVLFVTVVPYCC